MQRALLVRHYLHSFIATAVPFSLENSDKTCANGAIRGVLMRTFLVQQSSSSRWLSAFSTKRSPFLRRYKRVLMSAVFLGVAVLMVIAAAGGQQFSFIPNGVFFPNPGGTSQTYSTAGGGIRLTRPFFQSPGTYGRSCRAIHQPRDRLALPA